MADTRPLSERLMAAAPGVPAVAALLREAAELARRVEVAPVGTCDYDAYPWLTVDDADLPESMRCKRVALVPVEVGDG